MPNKTNSGSDLLYFLKSRFPSVKLGNSEGMTTVNPNEAVFFDFDFIVDGEKIASVSISIAEDNNLKLFYSKDILTDQDNLIKTKWFDFLRDLRLFAKKRLMTFNPNDITKKKLDKRDYEQMSAETKTEESKMTESALYGSTKSSYQKLENARLIIRHSQKVNEESVNSRTRNIDSIYVENAQGERFRYPFNHLSGARAMMRHLANGGNPYDNFGQYIVGLSENVYNLRKFNNLMHRNAFLENAELTSIASAAREKTVSLKKVIERIQKQSGYEAVKENFTEYKKAELDADTLNSLKERFTIQQFNEELVDLFPYISDLLGEETVTEGGLGEIGKLLGGKIGEAPANVKRTDKSTDADATLEPISKEKDDPIVPKILRRLQDAVINAARAGEILVEPWDKNSILQAMAEEEDLVKELQATIEKNPKDKEAGYNLEKARSRVSILQKRLSNLGVAATDKKTQTVFQLQHLGSHVKDDELSSSLKATSDHYREMTSKQQKAVNMMIKFVLGRLKVVPMFSNESTSFEELESMLGKSQPQVTSQDEKIDLVSEYEQLLSQTIDEQSDILSTDEDVRNRAIGELNQLISDEFPVGTNGVNAIESLRGIIDDRNLFNQFMEMSQEDAGADVRQQIVAWVQENAPDVMSELQVKGIEMPKINKAPEENSEEEPEAEEVDKPINEVEDFVKSLYDRTTGNFPRGETGVLTSVAKKFGDSAVPVAEKVIEGLKQSFEQNMMRLRELAGVSSKR